MTGLKKKRLSLSEKYNAITKVESGTKPSMVAKKYAASRNTISTWQLPGNKEKITSVFLSAVSLKSNKYFTCEVIWSEKTLQSKKQKK